MKRLLLLGIGSALMFTMGGVGPAMADSSGSTHKSTGVGDGLTGSVNTAGARCAGCHRAHTAKASMLLKQAQPALCYSCHGPAGLSSVLDVVDGVDRNTQEALRGGGFQFALLNGAAGLKTMGPTPVMDPNTGKTPRQEHSATAYAATGTPVAVTSNHKIDGVESGTMWGNGAISADIANAGKTGVILECGSCHDPHGNGNYRLLKPVPNDSGLPKTANPVTGSLTVDAVAAVGIVIPDAVQKNYTTADYWNVADRQVPLVKGSTTLVGATVADGFIKNIGAWCSTCHTRYLAAAPDYATNSGDANFTYRHTSARADKPAERPNCIQCHVSHGSNVSMTGYAGTEVGFPGEALNTLGNAVSPSADSRLLRVNNRGTCAMCHNE